MHARFFFRKTCALGFSQIQIKPTAQVIWKKIEKIPSPALEKIVLLPMTLENKTSLFDTNFTFYLLCSPTVTFVSHFRSFLHLP